MKIAPPRPRLLVTGRRLPMPLPQLWTGPLRLLSLLVGTGVPLVAGGVLLLGGCGSPGAPQPPSLKLPTPPTDLSAARQGGVVTLHWTMPRRAVDGVTLTGDQRAVVCRSLAPAPCTTLTTLLLAPGAPASFRDSLPDTLQAGAPRLLAYTLLVQNHRGKAAGPSNVAYTAAGAAPPAVTALQAGAETQGIVLRWQIAAQGAGAGATASTTLLSKEVPVEHLVRLHRTRLSGADAKKPAQAGVSQPVDQTLALTDGPAAGGGTMDEAWRLDHAIDQDAALNHSYRYTVERVARLTLVGHTLEVASQGSEAAMVEARDLFPPSVPVQLDAVADTQGGAIDLSWVADVEPDLAGYYVYRRAASSHEIPTRVSGASPLPNPGWRDTTAQPGIRYAYSVSAVDASGNESARSSEAEESVTPAAPLPGPAHPIRSGLVCSNGNDAWLMSGCRPGEASGRRSIMT